jgi:hypothetical protein
MVIDGSSEDTLQGLEQDAARLRRVTTGNKEQDAIAKELDAIGQIIGRIVATIGDLERRVRALEPGPDRRRPHE